MKRTEEELATDLIQMTLGMGNFEALTIISAILINLLDNQAKQKDLTVMEGIIKDVRKVVKAGPEGRGWRQLN